MTEPLTVVREALAGEPVWLVGGAVRDRLLGRPTTDLDLAVGADVRATARRVARAPTWIGTLPIGYADGVRRGLSDNADVLVAGRRVPLVGAVSMDNITVDLGPEDPPAPGTPATLIGGGILAEEVAARLGTINYEVTCGISARVPRVYHRDGAPVA